jgi:hypothetical protein
VKNIEITGIDYVFLSNKKPFLVKKEFYKFIYTFWEKYKVKDLKIEDDAVTIP